MAKVVILQEYVPQYRVPFFESLHREAKTHGIDVRVAYGSAGANQATRKDAGEISCGTPIAQKEWNFAGRRLVVRDTSAATAGADLIILEQARRNLDAYKLLTVKSSGRPIVALWGHGRDYTQRTSGIDRALSRWLTSRADWFFAYTNGGLASVVADKFPSNKVTVVQNSIDTSSLRASVKSVSKKSLSDFSERLGLKGKTALFIGGLDSSKRLEFLIAAAQVAQVLDADFRLLIAGSGPARLQVEEWSQRFPWITYLGGVSGYEKAQAMAASQILAMPGRVGLVAVDSFAAELPIVTTDWPLHAPEFEYLTNGKNAIVTSDDESTYAATMIEAMSNSQMLTALKAGASRDAETYTLQSMVSRFFAGIVSALAVRNS
ncbi:glycosyltransferase family 4 protein [Pseudarthrobacter sp. NamE2]|uniref:glycosyltransferase family 4 protein n=1 Tax=Pseudarthrobacter sp. NamE2 TaxID=2576838 RepID=UPI0010FF0A74|nr:glycosyltransferase family 4 protein [Pseudarthrobacter sp. NamE2]TLM84545.1 glycosyltransferase family 4 protein [Pseudarthrobacter sp. NamE2]